MHDIGILRSSAGFDSLGESIETVDFLVLFSMLYLPLDLPVVLKLLLSLCSCQRGRNFE